MGRQRKVVDRKRFLCDDTAAIRDFFAKQGDFQVVVEATANYEWFFLLVEDLADRCVLSHPKKLRVIAESKHKTDKIDAHVLAEFLALDMIPEAYRPSPRIRKYRVLVRHERHLQNRMTSLKSKLHNKAAHYNEDIARLFTERGQAHLAKIAMSAADRFETEQLLIQLEQFQTQLKAVRAELRRFAQTAPAAEDEARAVLNTIPQVGRVTIDVVISELGDWRRFRSAKRVVSYAGLDPGIRESAGKVRQLGVTKDAIARKRNLSATARLDFHQAQSGSTMKELQAWLARQFEDRLVEPNSTLGGAISYMLRHWERLTLFLRVPGAPLDNNICERALKKAILHRKNALFYKTTNGAHVGDIFMSLIYTCEFCGANPFDYLTELERHAGELASNPQRWMPWNYRSMLDGVSTPSGSLR